MADQPGSPPERAAVLLHRWLGLVAVAALLASTLVATHHGLSDPDTFWHLRAGHTLLASGDFVPPSGSSFSTRPWVLHEWAPEVLLAWGDAVAGVGGVVWVWELLLVGLLLTVYGCCRSRAPLLPAACATAVAWVGLTAGTAARPQLVSFAFAAVTVVAWLATADDLRPRWWLVPMGWVWACCHGFWFVGPGVGLLALAAILLDRRGPRPECRRVLQLLAVPVLTVVVAALTPVGPQLLAIPLRISATTGLITEWQPPGLGMPSYAAVVLALLTVVLVWVRRGRAVPLVEVALWALALVVAAASARTVALGAVVMAPVLARALHHALPTRVGLSVSRRRERLVVGGAAGIVLVVALATVGRGVVDRPTGLDANLDALPAGTVVYNAYDVGGWLFWAHPGLRPVIDGRTEIFADDYVRATFRALQAKPGWQDSVASSGARAALLADDSPLADALVHQLTWHVIARQDGYLLLTAP